MTSVNDLDKVTILRGDAEDILTSPANYIESNSVDTIFCSPDPIADATKLVKISRILGDKAKRVLKPGTGTMWVHMEDYYDEEGSLMQFPERFAIRMHDLHKWLVRSHIIWHMKQDKHDNPEKLILLDREGRPIDTNRFRLDYSMLYFFTQCRYGYFFDNEKLSFTKCSIHEEDYKMPAPGTFETGFSQSLITLCLCVSCPPGGTVLDPFAGTGTTGEVALRMGYKFIGIEKDEKKAMQIGERLKKIA